MATIPIDQLETFLHGDEIIQRGSERYTKVVPRSIQPAVVIQPKTVESLGNALAFLSATELRVGIEGQKMTEGSAIDVLVSIAVFNEFEFDAEKEIVTVGIGQSWIKFNEKMKIIAPNYTEQGQIFPNDHSLLSDGYELLSNSANLLGAQVVKTSGSVTWVSKGPGLLLALRDATEGFASIKPQTQTIYSS